MAQNRNKLIELFIGNISNAIVHNILERAIKNEKQELADKYRKELTTSFQIAKKYREKINPINSSLPEKDFLYIKEKITRKVKMELSLRISKGYKNIDLNVIDEEVDRALGEMKII